jgi:uncharacterized protein YukE
MPLIIDQPSTVRLVSQFADTNQDVASGYSNIGNVASNLAAAWRSDTSAPAFQNALTTAQNSCMRIRTALHTLDAAMRDFANATDSTEDNNKIESLKVNAIFEGGGGWAS